MQSDPISAAPEPTLAATPEPTLAAPPSPPPVEAQRQPTPPAQPESPKLPPKSPKDPRRAAAKRRELIRTLQRLANQHEDAVALDAWLRKVWEPAADAARESKAKLAAFLASELELEAEVGAERWRRELQSSANKYRTGNVTNQYVTMVPELFTGLILILSTVLTLIMFFCCCLAEIEAPTAWAKQYPAKGKEFN